MPRPITFAAAGLMLAAPAFAASPDAWEAYETQVRLDCEAALAQRGQIVSGEGPVAHGTDDLGSFLILSAASESGDVVNWLCRAPRGDGPLAVELIELPPGYRIEYADDI